MSQLCLGIDPGLANCGWAIVQRGPATYKLIELGCIVTATGRTYGYRLARIADVVSSLLKEHQPDCMAIEAVYFNKNVSSNQTTAAVVGVLSVEAHRANIESLLITPQQAKAATGMGGKADKATVKKMMGKLLAHEFKNAHTADAAAIAMAGLLQ